jgi:DNA mismatch endonuclease (patch repair protein)
MDHVTRSQRSSMMRAVKSKDTRPELAVRRALHREGFRYRLHVRALPGSPDIVFPSRRTVVFVHGCFWHGHDCPRGKSPTSNVEFWVRKIEENKRRDGRTTDQLQADRWRVITIWECQTRMVQMGQHMRSLLGSLSNEPFPKDRPTQGRAIDVGADVLR